MEIGIAMLGTLCSGGDARGASRVVRSIPGTGRKFVGESFDERKREGVGVKGLRDCGAGGAFRLYWGVWVWVVRFA